MTTEGGKEICTLIARCIVRIFQEKYFTVGDFTVSVVTFCNQSPS